jgi:hypothetical protein
MKYTVTAYKQQAVLSSTLTVEGNDTEDAFRAAYKLIDAGAVDWQPVNDEETTWCGQAVPVEPEAGD